MGGKAAKTAEIQLTALSSLAPADSLALQGTLFIPTLKWPAGAGRGQARNYSAELPGDA
jgi:hypothetical protein